MFTFAFKEHATDVYILEDGKPRNRYKSASMADAQDDEGNTFATSADLVAHLEKLSRSAGNLRY